MEEKASSIGLKSGEYGGKNSYRMPLDHSNISNDIQTARIHLPLSDKIQNGWILVDTAVVHHNN
jgi:hypothetical protein